MLREKASALEGRVYVVRGSPKASNFGEARGADVGVHWIPFLLCALTL
jgi:hypothetical protein